MAIARKLTINGKTQSVLAWSKELGISATAIHKRLAQHWTDEQALGFAARPPRSRASFWTKTEQGWVCGIRAATELGINLDDYQ